MGCRKLTYYTTETTPLKVATGKGLESEKVVQGFLSVDPLAHMFPHQSPYMAMDGNPILMIDPTGMSATKYEDEMGNFLAETDDGSTDVVTITNDKLAGFKASFKGTSKEMRDTPEMNELWKKYSGYNIKSDKLDPSTLFKNIGNQHYPGGNNPQTYPDSEGNRKPHYGTTPVNLAGYPAMGHDKSYDILKINGASGLLSDTRAIGADYRFVRNEFRMGNISMMTGDYSTAARAYGLGVGLGVLALPKTLFQLSKPQGFLQIMMWDAVSQPRQSNTPPTTDGQ